MLPAEVVSPDQIDDVMSIFGEMDIEVVDANQRVTLAAPATNWSKRKKRKKRPKIPTTTWSARPAIQCACTCARWARFAAEPRGEVEIAKKIESGENRVLDEVLSSPLALTIFSILRKVGAA